MKFSWLLLHLLLLVYSSSQATDLRDVQSVTGSVEINTPNFLITQSHEFHGLAFVYNEVQPIYVLSGEVHHVNPEGSYPIPVEADYVGWKSRYQLGVIKNHPNLEVKFNDNHLTIDSNSAVTLEVLLGSPDEFEELNPIKYSHLWNWMRWLTVALEWLLKSIHGFIGHWGISIILFSLVVRVLLFPVGQLTAASQRKVSLFQAQLEPKLIDIKQNYQGEEAHNRLMAAHKQLGITPFFSLKPMLLNLIQFPILIAVFNMLGELAPLEGVSFLWINDLSTPDAIFYLPFTGPFMGDTFNLLPFLMTVITVISTVTFKNNIAPLSEVKRQKRNLYLMAFGFFILCYPFPSSMVLYWALANFWQFITQSILNKREQTT